MTATSDQQKGDDLGGGVGGDEAVEKESDVAVVPAGQQDAGDQASEGEEFEQDAAQKAMMVE